MAVPCEMHISTRSKICIIESRVSRRERELPTFSLILRDENENFTTQSCASRRDREIQSLYLEIRDEIEKIVKQFSVFIPDMNIVQEDPKEIWKK